MRIQLDRGSNLPLYQQVATAIRQSILSGDLDGGVRLPATRRLAETLGIHRNTVVTAYRRLEEEGFLRSAVGAGTFVVRPVPAGEAGMFVVGSTPAEAAGGPGAEVDRSGRGWDRRFSWRRLLRNPVGSEPSPMDLSRPSPFMMARSPILLNGALPDSRQFPMDEFTTCMQEVLAEADPRLLEYGPTEGYEPLRSWIVEWLRDSGVENLDAGRVFIVSGSQQGIDLLARLFLSPGDRVVVEAPTYTGAFMVLREAGARVVPVPVDGDGLKLTALDEALDREAAKFLYVMPCYQNPTGVSLSSARRIELLRLARRRGLAIIEDHYDTPLHYWGTAPRPLLADEPEGQVIHLGTFSKILFPGLRLGWMVVPEEISRTLRQLRWATDLSSGMLTQRVMDRFCRSGRLERHLKRLCRVNRRRLRAMLGALEEHFPPEARWTRPSGGMTLWAELPEWIDTLEVFREAASKGVLFTPGTAFYPNGGGRNAMRLSFNREGEARIRRGVRLLGGLIKERLRTQRGDRQLASDAMPFL